MGLEIPSTTFLGKALEPVPHDNENKSAQPTQSEMGCFSEPPVLLGSHTLGGKLPGGRGCMPRAQQFLAERGS